MTACWLSLSPFEWLRFWRQRRVVRLRLIDLGLLKGGRRGSRSGL